MYVIDTVRGEDSEPTTVELDEPAAVLAHIEAVAEALTFLVVADVRGNVDCGNLLIWLHGTRAFVRLDEHRELYATDPALESGAGQILSFWAEGGGAFEVPFTQTVSRGQAFEALDFWLTTGGRLPALVWS